MVANLGSHTDVGDYDLPPRSGVLKKYKRSKLSSNAQRVREQTRMLELEAYKAVLRAFGAQSNSLSWERFGLMSELRRELRVTDDQHKELVKVTDDAAVRKIRELRELRDRAVNPQQVDPPPQPPATGRKRKPKTEAPEEEAPAPVPVPRPPPVTKKVFARQKKKQATPPPPDLSTLDALRNEVERLESDPDLNRLVHAKTAAHEMKRKILDALEQCRADDEDSERTAEDRRDDGGEEDGDDEDEESEDDEKYGEKDDVKTEVDVEN